jgi:transcriptional regulator NrdR family protein
VKRINVIKRDGRIVEFDDSRILIAINKYSIESSEVVYINLIYSIIEKIKNKEQFI